MRFQCQHSYFWVWGTQWKHWQASMTYLIHDELPVWRHFQNGHHEYWRNHVFACNSASRVDRNEISMSTPIFFRVRNSIKAITGFYDLYLTHDELPVWCHFQNGCRGSWQNHVFSSNSASRVDRNEISVSTLIFLSVGNSMKALTSFYDLFDSWWTTCVLSFSKWPPRKLAKSHFCL